MRPPSIRHGRAARAAGRWPGGWRRHPIPRRLHCKKRSLGRLVEKCCPAGLWRPNRLCVPAPWHRRTAARVRLSRTACAGRESWQNRFRCRRGRRAAASACALKNQADDAACHRRRKRAQRPEEQHCAPAKVVLVPTLPAGRRGELCCPSPARAHRRRTLT